MSLGSFGCALVVIGFTAVAGFIEVRPEGVRGYLASVGPPMLSLVSYGLAVFIGLRPGVRWVH